MNILAFISLMIGTDVLIICFCYFWLVSTSVFEPVTPLKEDPVTTIGNDSPDSQQMLLSLPASSHVAAQLHSSLYLN